MSYNDSYGGGGGERGYGGGGGGYDDRQGGGYGGQGGGYDDRQGGGYGGGGGGGYDDRQQSGSGYGRQDPSEYSGGGGRGSDNYYNQGSNIESEGRNYGGGPGNNLNFQGGNLDDDDYSGAVSHAQQYSSGSGDDSLFSSVLGNLKGNKKRYENEDIDEGQMVGAHQAMYGGGGESRQHGSDTVGAGAAMQALKMFTGSGGEGGSGHQGGGGQNALVGMAMGQASKLYDEQSSQGKLVSLNSFSKACLFGSSTLLFPFQDSIASIASALCD